MNNTAHNKKIIIISLIQVTTNVNVSMKYVLEFSLQDYKQKSVFKKYYFMSFSQFSFSSLFSLLGLIHIYCDRQYCPVLYFLFCISIIYSSFYEIYHNEEQRKAVDTKSVVLINCRKKNHQQKNKVYHMQSNEWTCFIIS